MAIDLSSDEARSVVGAPWPPFVNIQPHASDWATACGTPTILNRHFVVHSMLTEMFEFLCTGGAHHVGVEGRVRDIIDKDGVIVVEWKELASVVVFVVPNQLCVYPLHDCFTKLRGGG